MNFKKYLVAVAVLIAVFVLVSAGSARVVADKEGPHKRVITHSEKEKDKAVALGCEIVRETKTLKALRCPQG
ncbi:MAG: hypothetical protein AAB456_04035, partial [Patescibacteria group bacterium]